MPSPREFTEAKIDQPVDIELVVAHMAASIGQEKAQAVMVKALADLQLPATGRIDGVQAGNLLTRLASEPGLVGLAAKVTRQMVKMRIAPLKPAF